MTQLDLTMRRTVIGGARLDNDFSVYFEGRRVGRIMFAQHHVKHVPVWRWQINPPLPVPDWANGVAASKEEAQAAFRAAWERFYAALSREDIAHWHQVADAR